MKHVLKTKMPHVWRELPFALLYSLRQNLINKILRASSNAVNLIFPQVLGLGLPPKMLLLKLLDSLVEIAINIFSL